MKTLFAALVASLLLSAVPVKAHFMWLAADDEVNKWLGRQHDTRNGYCCDGSDAFVYDGEYTINGDGSVSLPLPDGTRQVIDAYKVLPYRPTDPNPTGGAVWWHNEQYHTYCFALGLLI